MNITLLRSAERPGSFIGKDDDARSGSAQYNDIGHHEFAFAFAVDHGEETLASELAEWLNRPAASLPAEVPGTGCLLNWPDGQFMVTMIRPAWQSGGVLIRIYERQGKHGTLPELQGISLTAVRPDGRNLDGTTSMDFHPFEIKTFQIRHDNRQSSKNQ